VANPHELSLKQFKESIASMKTYDQVANDMDCEAIMKVIATNTIVRKFVSAMIKKTAYFKARKDLIQDTFIEMAQEMQEDRSMSSRQNDPIMPENLEATR
jgi:hypothetical protein